MKEGVGFEKGFTKGNFSNEVPSPKPELQVVVPKSPEVERMPPDMAELNIDDFLKRQQEEDEKRSDTEKKPRFDA
ncbi:MAG: hypothetical protein ACYCZZ_00605 [Minisyncoccota bacterium]